jgi:hypothetical protein
MLTALSLYGKEILSLVIAVVTWLARRSTKARAKLLFANPHTFTHLIPARAPVDENDAGSPGGNVPAQSFVLWNAGKETATNVEWTFNWRPASMNFWPSRRYTDHTASDGRYTVVFDSLAPNEVLGCEILAFNQPLPAVLQTRCDQCVSQTIRMYPQPITSPGMKRARAALSFLGLVLLIYLAFVTLQLVVLKTPLAIWIGPP